ncbi:MAG: LysE family translocator, partial [Chloroflexi bacterium]|nr:LysE family translocator [Chloroflexota bacterium]
AIIELLLVVALALGLSRLLQQSIITQIIAFLGGAFLLWMAFGMLKGVVQGKVSIASAASEGAGWRMPRVVAGALVSLANPYWSLWWATIGLAYVLTSLELGPAGVAAFYVGHILADLIWYSSVSAVLGSGRRFLNDFVYRSLIAVCAVFLVFLSLYFITSATGVVPKFL